jgi:hypothetical protein
MNAGFFDVLLNARNNYAFAVAQGVDVDFDCVFEE